MEFYKHSGKSGLIGVPVTAAIGTTVGIVLGVVYTYLINWIPLIYINFFITLFFGAAIGYSVGWGAKVGKIRNNFLLPILGVVCALIGLYVAWAFDPLARFGDQGGEIVWSPAILWQYIVFGYENGFWGIGRAGNNNQNVSGIFLAAVWLLEAGIIVGMGAVVALSVCSDLPFCEETNEWTERELDVAQLSPFGPGEAALNRLVQGDVDALADFYRTDHYAPVYLRLDLTTANGCEVCNFLTVKLLQTTIDKDGKEQANATDVLVNLRVAADDIPKIRNAGQDPPPEPDATDDDLADFDPEAQPDESPEADEPPKKSDFDFG